MADSFKRKEKEEKTEPVWLKDDQQWELTWPIWHMLPRDERKTIANRFGYKTIGEFEEYMTLTRAVDVSEASVEKPYENRLAYPLNLPTAKLKSDNKKEILKRPVPQEEDKEDEDSDCVEIFEDSAKQEATQEEAPMTQEELLSRAGLLLSLPEELLHSIFEYLPIDMYAPLALVSPYWKYITRTEAIYKRLCERCYLNQSKRRALHVARFGGSYRNMLTNRPRVRIGLYVFKFAKVKKIQRDMWTEVPVGAVLETVYYRYIFFQENGTVLYALTASSPHEMIPRLCKMRVTGEPDRAAVWGHFQVQGKTVTVVAKQEWHTVKMVLSIQPKSIWGRFGALTFDRHLSSASGDFDEYFSQDLVEYEIPSSDMFQYLRDKRL